MRNTPILHHGPEKQTAFNVVNGPIFWSMPFMLSHRTHAFAHSLQKQPITIIRT